MSFSDDFDSFKRWQRIMFTRLDSASEFEEWLRMKNLCANNKDLEEVYQFFDERL